MVVTGVEIVGLVLGSFPILLNCLDYYREGFEPLEEWWNFRTHFNAFVDDIQHQMMRYHENMLQLLDPLIADNETLIKLVHDPRDTRWHDGSLEAPLERRLASERDRFFRVIGRMQEVLDDLKRLLKICNGQVSWTGGAQNRPWEWHLIRIRLSFSKGKLKKVRKLEVHNQELQEILGYGERVIPIANRRKSSEPVSIFEKIRQNASCLSTTLRRYWKCDAGKCQAHHAHFCVQAKRDNADFIVVFVLQGNCSSHKQEVILQRVDADSFDIVEPAASLAHVHQNSDFKVLQQGFNQAGRKSTPDSRELIAREKTKTQQGSIPVKEVSTPTPVRNNVIFAPQNPTICVSNGCQASGYSTSVLISDLCAFLSNGQRTDHAVIFKKSDHTFSIRKCPERTSLNAANLIPLSDLLDGHQKGTFELPRQARFSIALDLASSLLQMHSSSWLQSTWSKSDFYFLVESRVLQSTHPYVSQTFTTAMATLGNSNSIPSQSLNEEDVRSVFFIVGVMILELIFGQTIESCPFRKDYYGSDHKPNDQTDVSTARKWATKVLGECGADMADIVRRCLDCSFGPRPNFSDMRFREAVYEGVIKPLAEYNKIWPQISP